MQTAARTATRAPLSKIACGFVSTIIFFCVLTQRMMISTENSALELQASQPTRSGFYSSSFANETLSSSNITIAIGKGIIEKTLDAIKRTSSARTESISKTIPTEVSEPQQSDVAPQRNRKIEGKKQHKIKNTGDAMNISRIMDINAYHPQISPRVGSNISESHQLSLLLCPNQSKCIVPELQLEIKVKVYFCRHPVRQGVRFYFLMREGLLLHPNVELVEEADMYTADYVIYLPGSAPWHKTECTNISLASKMIVMDEFDGHTLFSPRKSKEELIEAYGEQMRWYFLYFKRSFVSRKNGKFVRYPHFSIPDVYPMTYALAEAYLQHEFNFNRGIEILCTLRGSPAMSTRLRVQEWVAEYGASREVKNIISAQLNGASRTTVNKGYFEQMYNSSIIVTVNPAHWEGDFRLWESFATGALVMVDPLFVPHSYPLIDGVHVIYYSNENKTDLFTKLDYYRKNPLEARKIAINGYFHTMKYHRTVNLVDYVLRSAHLQSAKLNGLALPNYTFTAQYINDETKKQEKDIKYLDRPGSFHGHVE